MCKDRLFLPSGLGKTSQNERCFLAYHFSLSLSFQRYLRVSVPPTNEPRMNIGSHASSCSVVSNPLTTSSSFACLIFTSFDVHDQTTSATPMLTLQPRKRTPLSPLNHIMIPYLFYTVYTTFTSFSTIRQPFPRRGGKRWSCVTLKNIIDHCPDTQDTTPNKLRFKPI